MEVPDRNSPWVPVPTAVENTLTPGALMSGLSWPSPMRGPPELNDANRRNDGLAMVVLASVAVAAAFKVAPSPVDGDGPWAPRKGMVTVNFCPVSGFEVMGPSNGG